MQNKGAIQLLTILMVLVCIYQLSFTLKTNSIRKQAIEFAKGNEQVEIHFLDSIAGEEVYNFLGIRKYTYRECQQREVNLGLDLKGGMNVILEVSVVDIVKSLAGNNIDTVFIRTMELAEKKQENSQETFVTLFGQAFKEVAPNGKLAQFFYGNPTLKGLIDFNSSNDEVLAVLKEQTQGAIDNSFNVLRNRIDKFGVAQPNIQKLEGSGRIMVELPGVKEPNRVRNILQSTAQLEFWETYENSEVYEMLVDANNIIKELNKTSVVVDSSKNDTVAVKSVNADTTNGELSLLNEIEADTTKANVGETNNMVNDYPLFALLIPSVTQDNKLMDGSVIGRSHVKDIKKVEEYLNMKQIRALFPKDMKFYWGNKPPKYDESQTYYELHAIKTKGREGKAPLDGDAVINARAEFGQTQASAEVTMTMNAEGAKTWARLTRENVGRCVAIVLDDQVYSAPRVNQEITGGNSQITGDFTVNEAKDLANVLQSGKLPAPAKIVQEAIVGPTLGKEAIASGINSFIIALIVIVIYLIGFYSYRAGTIANIGLLFNLFFQFGVLASLGAVLTLPGIAGIILTIGMSVDANVLIYERIREEINAGKGVKQAVKDGYKHALSAIIDGNVTTILIGIILYIFGSGPIRGFATTLVIGILTSLFAALFITRVIFEALMDKNVKLTFENKISANFLKNVNIPFIQLRKYGYIISILITVVGIVALTFKGLNQGIDFSGGRAYIVKMDKVVSTADISKALADEFETAPTVITYGKPGNYRITTKYRIDDRSTEADVQVEKLLYTGLKGFLPAEVSEEIFLAEYRTSSEKVGPTIADDIKKEAVFAVLLSILAIFIYVAIRFNKWVWGFGAAVALIHDGFMIVTLYSLVDGIVPFSMEIDQAFIAAILTVIGYSVNDSVIIFDRVREYMHLTPKRDKMEMFNAALNSTLGRTFNTTFTTLVVLVVTFLLGGEMIRGFVFAMAVGIFVGTYSSLFIGTPIAYEALIRADKKK